MTKASSGLYLWRDPRLEEDHQSIGHPLLQKEKILESTVRRILPKTIADSVRPKEIGAFVWLT